MRIGSIGYELPGVETVSYRSASTLLELDVVLLDLGHVPASYSSGEQYDGRRLITERDSPTMLADIDRRRGELKALLELGKTIVIFVPGDLSWFVHTGKTRNDGTAGRPRITRIVDSRDAGDLLPFAFRTTKAAGTQFDLRAGEPFSTFWRKASSLFEYLGYVNVPELKAVMIRGTDFPVAGVAKYLNGRVIFLPDVGAAFWEAYEEEEEEEGEEEEAEESKEGEREEEAAPDPAQVLVDAVAELVRALSRGETALPGWTERFRVTGETELLEALSDRQRELVDVQKAVDQAREELAVQQQDKVLFAGTGESLRQRVAKALKALGAEIIEDEDEGRADLIIRWRGQVAVVEVKGVAGSAGERDAAQLEKWAAENLEETGEAPKPILVINAFRDREDLSARVKDAFPKQMRPYAEARGQCLVTSLQLLLMEISARADSTEGERALDALFSTVGVIDEFLDLTPHIVEVTSEPHEDV
jgi:hypothetical protein